MDEEREYAPLLPFNSTIGENFTCYNNTKYIQDKSLCEDNPVCMESGNVLKFYRANFEAPVKIGGD